MEIIVNNYNEYDNVNPKRWASKKRQQRYNDPNLKRKANSNGHSLRKIVKDYYFERNSELFGFNKTIREPTTDDGNHHYQRGKPKIYGTTDFEENLNVHMLTKTSYSLNKNKNWEKIPQIINVAKADEKWKVIRGKSSGSNMDQISRLNWTKPFECDRTYLAYFDMEELQNKMQQIAKKHYQYNKKSGLDDYIVDDINNYVRDNFYKSIQQKGDRLQLKRWKEIQSIRPKNISKHCKQIAIKSITARTVKKGCKLKRANVKSFGLKSFWSPQSFDDKRDYIQIDLGKNIFVEAVSTRGRCLKRNVGNFDIDYEKSFVEYVKKYKILIKKDDGKEIIKHHNKSKKNKKKKKEKSFNDNEDFISLGTFCGNKDSETEVANKLKLPNNNKTGVLCRYIRIYPLSHGEGGFYGNKAMRVGVYGSYEIKNDQKKNNNQAQDKEENNNSTIKNGEIIMRNNDVAAAIISIMEPSSTYKRSCWGFKSKLHPGVYSCGCRMCSMSHVYKSRRKDARNYFKKQVKNIKHVDDYSIYNSDTIYLRQRRRNCR